MAVTQSKMNITTVITPPMTAGSLLSALTEGSPPSRGPDRPAPPAGRQVASRAGARGSALWVQPGAAATGPRTVAEPGRPGLSAALSGTAGPKRTAERQPVKPRAPARSVAASAPRGPAGRGGQGERGAPGGLPGPPRKRVGLKWPLICCQAGCVASDLGGW